MPRIKLTIAVEQISKNFVVHWNYLNPTSFCV